MILFSKNITPFTIHYILEQRLDITLEFGFQVMNQTDKSLPLSIGSIFLNQQTPTQSHHYQYICIYTFVFVIKKTIRKPCFLRALIG